MGKAKKFGAFGGVFTPSILTILGVIMYMRLGWVVGQAGLIAALAIILISHIISISTGLSIASVATDKKIKTGGIYYILSRSLGMPMGGSIGLTLFVGTAMSISLYLVGFAESFLSVDVIREFLGLEQNTNGYRIIGSIFLLILAIIAFISTSLAIKSQYFILTAIFLSLVSVVLGFIFNTDFQPETMVTAPAENGESLAVIFGIFFPAVTGFTAGVAMSGDLRDPRKDIPAGTIGAIAVGLIVYVALAIGLAYFVNRDMLINDVNFLMKVAYFSPLVLAGIWGATLSSGLGGILGGPRILQAIAKDKMSPRIFAKGKGDSNEPRNALILTFLIAEGGILIGELNVIAGVVSMFYLASYSFINLAFFLEKWASTDFRPSFKISKYFGLIGFIAGFIVMSQLDMLSMVAALVIMLLLYLLLRRRQLKNDTGDVWQSVWLSVMRQALRRMDKKEIEERNWQPNIVMFSGGTSRRPHIIEFGKSLVGRYGLLSNFDLHESKEEKYLFPKHLQSLPFEDINTKGVFTRRQTCSNIYLGIETIVSTYGFSGIDPNTVLMGWARQTKNPVRFAKMIRRLDELDVNILLIDYDKRYGYGDYKTIDIWWRGGGQHGNLSLSLIKVLWASKQWNAAEVRLIIVNPVNNDSPHIRKRTEAVLDNMRINVEVKILNNQIEQNTYYDLIRTESIKTDLIMLGMPDIEEGKEDSFVKDTSELMADIGTVVLVRASSKFKSLHIGLKTSEELKRDSEEIDFVTPSETDKSYPPLPGNRQAAADLSEIHEKLQANNKRFFNSAGKSLKAEIILLSDFFKDKKNLSEKDFTTLIRKSAEIIKLRGEAAEAELSSRISEAVNDFIAETENILLKSPDYRFITFGEEELKIKPDDSKADKRFKKRNSFKLKFQKEKIRYKVKFKPLLNNYIPAENYLIITDTLKQFRLLTVQSFTEQQALLEEFKNVLSAEKDKIADSTQKFEKKRFNYLEFENKILKKLSAFTQNRTTELVKKITEDMEHLNINAQVKRNRNKRKQIKTLRQDLEETGRNYARFHHLLLNALLTDIYMLEFEYKLNQIFKTGLKDINDFYLHSGLSEAQTIRETLHAYREKLNESETIPDFPTFSFESMRSENELFEDFKNIFELKFQKFKNQVPDMPPELELLSPDALNNLSESDFSQPDTLVFSPKKLSDFIIQNEIFAPLMRLSDTVPQKITALTSEMQNIMRLFQFSFFDSEGKPIKQGEKQKKELLEFLDKQYAKSDESLNGFETEIKETKRKVRELINNLSGKLNSHILLKYADGSLRLIKRTPNESKIRRLYKKLVTNASDQLNRLWYRHSEAVLLKEKIDGGSQSGTHLSHIHYIREQLSPSNKLMQKLPFYYRRLFSQNAHFNSEFWYERPQENQLFAQAAERFKSGYGGGILITGERFSGKSFFLNEMIKQHLPNFRRISIQSEELLGLHESALLKVIAHKAKLPAHKPEAMKELPRNTLIVLDDFEKMWLKHPEGFEIVKLVKKLITQHGNRLLFVIALNTHSYKILNRAEGLSDYFLEKIELSAFNAEQLQKVILFRHRAGGLRIGYNGKINNNINRRETAKLFAKHFNFSRGNIGISLYNWTANITDFKDETVFIRKPKSIDYSPLKFKDFDLNIILLQLVLHKDLSKKDLLKLTFLNKKALSDKLSTLTRAGIINKNNKQKIHINPYMYPLVKHLLEDENLL